MKVLFPTIIAVCSSLCCLAQFEGKLKVDCRDSIAVKNAMITLTQRKFKRPHHRYRAEYGFDVMKLNESPASYFFVAVFFDDDDPEVGSDFPACANVIGMVDSEECTYQIFQECGFGYGRSRAAHMESEGIKQQ